LLLQAEALQRRFGSIHAINPLPTVLHTLQPTTGYEDVKAVAIARLAAPNVASVQIDWLRYGPKLAQVALTFGADDLDGVTASDDAPDGRRRAPLEDVKRSIEAAGFSPVERNGRFQVVP
jgi:aminodeoxyfutalosine synthase